ncbi:hypothetical protein [Lachnotalea sp. AF33-28]|uniref:hypothetical protein n=1 Tax=Lachnotalea sp. AF33-28 TaxID=2292046 RepID=UPI000E52AA60|nr:hypothetical protein [Lachnotalea sp. AF33-28]RHP33985.1 hypothetical protein DWZ56_08965 [Lachnotalea sp. AF33-28]
MIKITNTSVMNFDNAIRGARNPMNSWAKGDSRYEGDTFIFGPNDLDLAKRLCRAGRDHRKFIRQIFVSVDIQAPLYWWKEFDTYKVGTVANSTSTMHKIHSKPFDVEDFSHDHLTPDGLSVLRQLVDSLEDFRRLYLETKDKQYWYTLIQLLPSSYNQLRTCTMNYENIRQIYYARKEHKLEEWRSLCGWMEELPYFKELFLE